jgi:histidine decarboxylase
MPVVIVRAGPYGNMDYDDLAAQLHSRRHHAAVIVATAGTTMSEAIDDVATITRVLDHVGVARRRIHVDAALSGIPLALLPDEERPAFDFTAGAHSMVISGHKFLGSLMPCGVLIHHHPPTGGAGRIAYTGSRDSTLLGSRSGHTPLILWHILRRLGAEGLRVRAERSRDLADYTHRSLAQIGWPAYRNPHAFTVVLATPPKPVRDRWVLAHDGQWSHIVCMPGITRHQIDAFLHDLQIHGSVFSPPASPPASDATTARAVPILLRTAGDSTDAFTTPFRSGRNC